MLRHPLSGGLRRVESGIPRYGMPEAPLITTDRFTPLASWLGLRPGHPLFSLGSVVDLPSSLVHCYRPETPPTAWTGPKLSSCCVPLLARLEPSVRGVQHRQHRRLLDRFFRRRRTRQETRVTTFDHMNSGHYKFLVKCLDHLDTL